MARRGRNSIILDAGNILQGLQGLPVDICTYCMYIHHPSSRGRHVGNLGIRRYMYMQYVSTRTYCTVHVLADVLHDEVPTSSAVPLSAGKTCTARLSHWSLAFLWAVVDMRHYATLCDIAHHMGHMDGNVQDQYFHAARVCHSASGITTAGQAMPIEVAGANFLLRVLVQYYVAKRHRGMVNRQSSVRSRPVIS
jgi:hypothetical protein